MYQQIFQEERLKFNLDTSFSYPYNTLKTRIRRDNLSGDGRKSPLSSIEPKLLLLIRCMNNIKHTLTVSEGIALANDLISNTSVQQKLIDWKLKRKTYHKDINDFGKIGFSCFHRFMKTYKYEIKRKSISKYAIDRTNFTIYLNFSDMYDHIEKF